MKSTTAVDRCEGFTHGDLVLRSVDGDEFHVHSAVLSVASPVFKDMFTACSRPIRAAHYDGRDIRDASYHAWIHLSETFSPLRIASSLGFQDEVNLAISVSQNQYQLNTIDCLLEVAERTPDSIPWIKLLAIPLIRNEIISDVLLNFYEAPMRLAGSSFTRALCESCSESHHYGAHNSPPEWQARWARGVTEELKKKPANEWERYFGTEYLLEAVSRYDMPIRTPRGDCTCVEKVKFYEYEFLGWSSHVLRSLQSRLECLKKLEALS
ncbi:hypothetical protein RHS01_05366 [Rhizoctonia solani]|uniref:BTB domain-containing protein n=1 Tax=Rhizoctonia solani TaxID=456999 RepID=A0A8H7M571_9AGAM|nr:hypothetical protein RHS01_05366 [Rhizoctonia solani]